MNKICIIQTGLLGDTIIVLPIAKYYYDMGYLVDWVIHENYVNVFKNIYYVNELKIVPKNIEIHSESLNYCYNNIDLSSYIKIIDLSICFNNSRVNDYCGLRPNLPSFVHTKYHLAEVEIEHKCNLQFIRNIENENNLFNYFNINNDYILVHGESSGGRFKNFSSDKYNIIEFRPIQNYNIFDWYKVALNAKEIHGIDSSLVNFIDGVKIFYDKPKFYHKTNKTDNHKWLETPLFNNWNFIS